jgi:hypothetical protein
MFVIAGTIVAGTGRSDMAAIDQEASGQGRTVEDAVGATIIKHFYALAIYKSKRGKQNKPANVTKAFESGPRTATKGATRVEVREEGAKTTIRPGRGTAAA